MRGPHIPKSTIPPRGGPIAGGVGNENVKMRLGAEAQGPGIDVADAKHPGGRYANGNGYWGR